jgi:hypothetical protein
MEQMHGAGGVLSFEVDGAEGARRLTDSLHLFTLAPSLGGVDSLVCIPVLTSHAMISAEQRQKMGVTEQLIRLSVGIENADDLIADLEQGLAVVSSARQHAEVGSQGVLRGSIIEVINHEELESSTAVRCPCPEPFEPPPALPPLQVNQSRSCLCGRPG